MVKTKLYFQVVKPDSDDWKNGNYQHATIGVFEVTAEEEEHWKKYNLGDGYVDDSTLVFRVSYQRDRTRDINGNETADPQKRVNSPWYAERIEDIKNGFSCINIDKLETAAKILRRMEKAEKKIYDRGLSISNGQDQFHSRVFLLKEIGAQELYFSREKHGYYVCTGMCST